MPVYTGNMTAGRAIRVYGRGIHQLATGSGDAAVESQSDGQYRTADFQLSGGRQRMSFGPRPAGRSRPAVTAAALPSSTRAAARSCRYRVRMPDRNVDDRPEDKDDPWKWVSKIK